MVGGECRQAGAPPQTHDTRSATRLAGLASLHRDDGNPESPVRWRHAPSPMFVRCEQHQKHAPWIGLHRCRSTHTATNSHTQTHTHTQPHTHTHTHTHIHSHTHTHTRTHTHTQNTYHTVPVTHVTKPCTVLNTTPTLRRQLLLVEFATKRGRPNLTSASRSSPMRGSCASVGWATCALQRYIAYGQRRPQRLRRGLARLEGNSSVEMR